MKDRTLWRKLQQASEDKNAELISRMWTDNPDLLHSVVRYQQLQEELTKTDMKRLKKLAQKGDISEKQLRAKLGESYITSPNRVLAITRNEEHISGLYREQKAQRKKKMKYKIWRNRAGACPICKAMNGQRRKINEPYSNNSYVTHAHPGCVCYEDYE